MEQNHRSSEARKMEFITNAVSVTCAVFSDQGSSVYLVVQKLCGAGWQISSLFLNLCLYKLVTSWLSSKCDIYFLILCTHCIFKNHHNLSDLLYKLPAAQCSGNHLGLVLFFEEGDSAKK